MDIVNILKQIPLEELDNYINNRIELLEKDTFTNTDYRNYIGFDLDINPNLHLYSDEPLLINANCVIKKYIPLDTKMVYGMLFESGGVSCRGNYYYLDDDSYIHEFCKFIHNENVCDEYDLFDYVLEFLNDYFGYIKKMDRVEMAKLIYKNDRSVFTPIQEHSITDFKGKNNALCSEYAALSHNILSFLGFDCALIIGKGNNDSHAFNVVSYIEYETGRKVSLLLDFNSVVANIDVNFNILFKSPYIYEIDKDLDEIIEELENKKVIDCEDYSMMFMHNKVLKLCNYKMRNYSLDIIIKKSE